MFLELQLTTGERLMLDYDSIVRIDEVSGHVTKIYFHDGESTKSVTVCDKFSDIANAMNHMKRKV